MNAQLFLDADAFDVVALAERTVVVDQELRHQEQRDALGARRRIRQARQHQMDDVLGEVVLAVGDEDLGAGNLVGAVALGLRLGAQGREVRPRLGLGQVHGAHPLAARHLVQVFILQLAGPVGDHRLDRALGQQRADAEGGIGRVPKLLHREAHGDRQALAAEFRLAGQGAPAAGDPVGIGLLPARRRRHLMVLKLGAVLVADLVQRRQDFLGELAGLAQDRIHQVVAEIGERAALDQLIEAGNGVHGIFQIVGMG